MDKKISIFVGREAARPISDEKKVVSEREANEFFATKSDHLEWQEDIDNKGADKALVVWVPQLLHLVI